MNVGTANIAALYRFEQANQISLLESKERGMVQELAALRPLNP